MTMTGFETFAADHYSGDDDEFAELFEDGDTAEEEVAAWELLNVHSDSELEAFLGKFFKKARRAVSPLVGQLMRSGAKSLLKKALPMVGGALGSVVPGAGTIVGGMAGSALSQTLGAEAEGMSDGDAQLEAARRVVRTMADVADRVATDPSAATNPRRAVAAAIRGAVQRHVPALLAPSGATGEVSGRWVRKGNTITLHGV
jgi:hypothetical protein